MQLEFTAEQDELRDSVRAVLSKESPVSLARSVVEDGASTRLLWETMVELGWPALTIAEEDGGVDLGFVEAGIVAEELGRVIAASPWMPTVTQYCPAIAECADPEQRSALLGAVAAGEVRGALAVAEDTGGFALESTATTVTPVGHSWRLDGRKRFVVADSPDEMVVVARLDGTTGRDGICAVAVPGDAVNLESLASLDGTRSFYDVTFDSVTVAADRMLGTPGSAASGLDRAFEQAGVALALETVGTCQKIFDVTVEYAMEREQFGVPIGSFQAVKHKLADCFVALERARATSYFAALAIAEDDDRRSIGASVAKAAAGDCQRLLSKEGIQLHGGIGFTWEHDMHLFVRRLKASEPLFGNAAWHRQRIADHLGV